MNNTIDQLLKQGSFSKENIIALLQTDKVDRNKIFTHAAKVKADHVGKKVYYRGLIEMSNICSKNCYYCGIRMDNKNAVRYDITDAEILDAVKFAYESNYGSVVLQAGEISSPSFTKRISNLLKQIKEISNNELGVTISLGEQPDEVYQEWFESGAHRYLLRIESSNPELYYKLHPKNEKHNFETRVACLKSLQNIGYQTGTGVMVGLPFQTYDDLANDLFFMKDFDIDMCGMGPYIEHKDTPLYEYKDLLLPIEDRFTLTLKMIALLRILMKDINIAAATALQAIDPIGREKAIKVGANIIMPNVTPGMYRDSYKLYENKPCTDEEAADCTNCMEMRIGITGDDIGYGEWGDSKHYAKRRQNQS
ncbi:MAG: [FeFe] hydrogenase H-cluster radical SAM maturase HydE [Bacteroidales bacterium]|jgi:biotin synthase|nr:[FeFe] hydrogenase H-cluster radical SAM maturase HydE [Bacteroidales bacterium]